MVLVGAVSSLRLLREQFMKFAEVRAIVMESGDGFWKYCDKTCGHTKVQQKHWKHK